MQQTSKEQIIAKYVHQRGEYTITHKHVIATEYKRLETFCISELLFGTQVSIGHVKDSSHDSLSLKLYVVVRFSMFAQLLNENVTFVIYLYKWKNMIFVLQ